MERVGKLERTPTGGIRVPARIARTGILRYQRADGTVVAEYRPPEEAFRAESLASLEDAVVTVDHPRAQLVTPAIAKQVSVGHVRDVGKRDGKFVSTSLAVIDGPTIEAIDQGSLVELSAGYTCVLDPTSGTDPETGERYDAVQRQVVYNHVALLPPGGGRAGKDVSLRLDGLEVRIGGGPDPAIRVDAMKVRIDGREYEVGSAEWAEANAKRDLRRDAELEEAKKKNTELEAALADAIKVRDAKVVELNAAEATITQLKKDLGEATDEEKMDARIAARAELHTKARKVLGAEAKLDGKSADAVKREVIAKLDGEKALLGPDGKPLSSEFVSLYFERRIGLEAGAGAPSDPNAKARADALTPAPVGAPVPYVNPYDWSHR